MTDQIKEYDVSYVGGGQKANGFKYRAVIRLHADDGGLLGRAYFHRDKATMPSTDGKLAGYVSCHYMSEDFPRVLDLLRNEEPVYVQYVPTWQIGIICTSLEPVGEGEGLTPLPA